jgi:hypothetical protein
VTGRLDGGQLTPAQIVVELDRYVVGQGRAKRSVAIALRNRWRRQNLPPELRDEVAPKNIIMIGPTGVGKTEIARRLARLAQAPFIKVEASKYTEVGYVGRDVESMIRDLTELAVNMVKSEMAESVAERAAPAAEERLLELLLPRARIRDAVGLGTLEPVTVEASGAATREKLREQLRSGRLDDRMIELEVRAQGMPVMEMFAGAGMGEMDQNLRDMLGNMLPARTKVRKVRVSEARRLLIQEETQKLIDVDEVAEAFVGDHVRPWLRRQSVQRASLAAQGQTVLAPMIGEAAVTIGVLETLGRGHPGREIDWRGRRRCARCCFLAFRCEHRRRGRCGRAAQVGQSLAHDQACPALEEIDVGGPPQVENTQRPGPWPPVLLVGDWTLAAEKHEIDREAEIAPDLMHRQDPVRGGGSAAQNEWTLWREPQSLEIFPHVVPRGRRRAQRGMTVEEGSSPGVRVLAFCKVEASARERGARCRLRVVEGRVDCASARMVGHHRERPIAILRGAEQESHNTTFARDQVEHTPKAHNRIQHVATCFRERGA